MFPLLSRYRFIAYRCFVWWCWGSLGSRVRVVKPACVVLGQPRQQGGYTGLCGAADTLSRCAA